MTGKKHGFGHRQSVPLPHFVQSPLPLFHTFFSPLSPSTTLCSIPSPPLPHFVRSPLPLYHTLFSPLSSFTTLCSVPSLTLPHFVQSPLPLYHTLFNLLSPFPHFVQSSHPHLTCLFLKFKDDFFKALWKSS